MLISTSGHLDRAIRDPAKAARTGEVTVRAGAVTPDTGMSLIDAAVPGGLKQVSFNLTYQPGDPEALKMAVGQLEGLTKTLAARAAPPAEAASAIRVGGAAGIGAVTGVAVGVMLTELGKLGQSSGNPFLSAAAVACGLLGAAAGAGVGSGIITIEFDKLGVKAKTA